LWGSATPQLSWLLWEGSSTLKAVLVYTAGGPEVARVSEVECPAPVDDQVLVEVAVCGVCGHDQADRMGLTKVPLPVILGHEVAGTVVDVGPKVRYLSVGDRVAGKQLTHCGRCRDCFAGRDVSCGDRAFVYGGFAEYVTLPESALLAVPPQVDFSAAAITACAVGTCLQALQKIARVVPGETVLVTGAGGGLGLHGAQVAAAMGARVLAVTSSTAKAARLGQLGIGHVVIGEGDWWTHVLDATDGRGAEVVLDNVGHPAVFRQAFRGLARHGRYVFTGQIAHEYVRLYPAFLFEKEALITGSASTTMSSFAEAMAMVADGHVSPVVTTYPFDDVVHAFTDLDNRLVTGRIALSHKLAVQPPQQSPAS
jgi:D-arabinose 1-dehydrogenase-like Zn-dependent alcohol dehydrogenase